MIHRPAEPALQFEDLSVAWSGRPAVHHLSGRVEHGDLLAIVGPNGAGKSTLLRAIAGELTACTGRILRGGIDDAWVLLAQDAGVDRHFPITVADWLSLGDAPRSGSFGRAVSGHVLESTLAQVGLEGFGHRMLEALSGGQFQRLRLARVALAQARLLLLDEPFNAIDAPTTSALMRILQDWTRSGRCTVLLVTHDLEQVRAHVPRTLLLARDPIAWGPTAEVLTPERLQQAQALTQDGQADAPWCTRPGHLDTRLDARSTPPVRPPDHFDPILR